jgi:hypothetical protein
MINNDFKLSHSTLSYQSKLATTEMEMYTDLFRPGFRRNELHRSMRGKVFGSAGKGGGGFAKGE